jgi:predicted esterase
MYEHHIRVPRTARYAVLGPSDSTAIREVWFVLHGYGQLAADFLRRFEALDNGTRLIVAPEALSRFYLMDVSSRSAAERPVGATWMTREERAQEIGDYVGYLDAVLGEVGARFTGRAWPAVTVLGFSQGTATAARWVSSGTARPSHLVLWGGLLPPELELTAPGHPVRRATLHLIVGSRDGFVTEPRLADEEARLRAAGLSWEVVRYDGGHGLHRETLLELARRLAAMPNG